VVGKPARLLIRVEDGLSEARPQKLLEPACIVRCAQQAAGGLVRRWMAIENLRHLTNEVP
jgi:hypothetical protein